MNTSPNSDPRRRVAPKSHLHLHRGIGTSDEEKEEERDVEYATARQTRNIRDWRGHRRPGRVRTHLWLTIAPLELGQTCRSPDRRPSPRIRRDLGCDLLRKSLRLPRVG
jgi:hypothetical protein